jgi:hypothetical protein
MGSERFSFIPGRPWGDDELAEYEEEHGVVHASRPSENIFV